MIFLIIAYALFVFFFFGFIEDFKDEYNLMAFYITELVIIGIFIIDIVLHIIALGFLYIKEYWNIVDVMVILTSIVFVLTDIFVHSIFIEGFFKIRGILRLLRIFLLISKLNALKMKKDFNSRSF
jgi:hypothetical protein